MFSKQDTKEITNAVLNAAHGAINLDAEYAEVKAKMEALGVTEFKLVDPLDSAIWAMAAEAIDQAFRVGFQVGQRPAAILGLLDDNPATVIPEAEANDVRRSNLERRQVTRE